MKITFYGYNCFIIESGDKIIAIDPGSSFYLPDFFSPLIPKPLWNQVTHIFVTHGDPDHHWYTDRMAQASGAKVICNKTMVKQVNGRSLILAPRKKGLVFTADIERLYPLGVNETIALDGMQVSGIIGTHGPLTLKVGPYTKTLRAGPGERFGYGEMGFRILLDGKNIINLGDTILHYHQWSQLDPTDILMIPIGGKIPGNTMDETDALTAVRIFNPKMVIPTHYNCGALFNKCYNPADDGGFKKEVEALGHQCRILNKGDSVEIPA